MACSAYISLFDDWDLLPAVLAQIAPRVDEIVVVDGAYRWMAPLLQAAGRDPARSDPRVFDALAPWAGKIRLIDGVWADEPAKRAAGFDACRHRWVWRVDADEVLFIDDAALDRHWAGGRAVARMDMPVYVAPGWVRATDAPERQATLFDRHRVSARDHLSYLWLVMRDDEHAALAPADPALISPAPVAFAAHLTHWRSPVTAASRARFYVLNWLRGEGRHVHWDPDFRYTAQAGFTPMLWRVGAERLDEMMLGHRITAGPPDLQALAPSPLTRAQEGLFAPAYGAMLGGLAALNAGLRSRPRALAWGEPYWIDVSTQAAAASLGKSNVLLRFGARINAAHAGLYRILAHAPWQTIDPLTVSFDGPELYLALPPPAAVLRECLTFTAWGEGSKFTRISVRK